MKSTGQSETATARQAEDLSRLRGSSPAKLRQRLTGDLDVIVLKAMRKEPQRRYASVEQFAEDIRRHLQGLPVAAVLDSVSYRTRKFIRRHKLGMAAVAVTLVAIAGGVAATLREARIAAANERRAERRFNDVRQLANSLMFEIHDSIEGLPGATPARKLIVQRSLQYLDSLSQEAATDVSLQRELASAYERIGWVQGNPEGSNLGDSSGAVESFGKALHIREKIASSPSRDAITDQIALAASYREMCGMNARYLGSIRAALDYCGKALSIAKRVQSQYPENISAKSGLAKVYEAIGRVYGESSAIGNAGDSYAALESHRMALALVEEIMQASPGDLNLRSWQGRLSFLTADDLFEIGHTSEALPLYQRATQTFEALTKQSNNPNYERSLVFGYQRMGDMLLTDGHYTQSVSYYRKQVEAATGLVAADPKNMVFRSDLAGSRATLGHALWRAGQVPESLASLRRGLAELADSRLQDSRARGLETTLRLWLAGALEKGGDSSGALRNYWIARDTYNAMCEADPTDVEDCLSLAGTEDRVARIYLRRGKIADALAEEQKALAISEPTSGGAKPNLEALYTVVNVYYQMGEAYAALARESATQRKAQLKLACTYYDKSKAAQQHIPEWRPITPNEFDSRDPKLIDVRLSSCGSSTAR